MGCLNWHIRKSVLIAKVKALVPIKRGNGNVLIVVKILKMLMPKELVDKEVDS
jgi:hypothetical protein